MNRIVILGAGAGLNSAILACLMESGIANRVEIVESLEDEDFHPVPKLVNMTPDQPDFYFPAHPQVTYSGMLRRGKKGKVKRW